ncbi:hypothetical protein EDD15DRAFT_2198661 [Pisolithus albus]|nr:hypothetical protein EDD15DRAFT_2198661 [Pisolithus albus]
MPEYPRREVCSLPSESPRDDSDGVDRITSHSRPGRPGVGKPSLLAAVSNAGGLAGNKLGSGIPTALTPGGSDYGIWSAGVALGLLKDTPACEELIKRIEKAAEDTMYRRYG